MLHKTILMVAACWCAANAFATEEDRPSAVSAPVQTKVPVPVPELLGAPTAIQIAEPFAGNIPDSPAAWAAPGAAAAPVTPASPAIPVAQTVPAVPGAPLHGPAAEIAQVPALSSDSCRSNCPSPVPGKPASIARKTSVNDTKPSASPDIGEPAQRAVAESQRWAENRLAMPVRDVGGRVVFPFGESAPTIVCAPLRVCDIELQPGEAVQGAPHIGDAVRWKVSPAVSGSDEQKITHLIIKPTEPGLDTNLIIPTDRRTYHLRLVSSTHRYVSRLAFDYPEDTRQAWELLSDANAGNGKPHGRGEMPNVAVHRLNFNYRIEVVSGEPRFKPLRVMDDGDHTYIAMNEDMPQQEAPALIGISPAGDEQMINYRLKGNMYVVDGSIHKLALISGVGRGQERVEISRDVCRKRGWFGGCAEPRG